MRKGLLALAFAFFLFSLGGLLLHVRIHLLSDSPFLRGTQETVMDIIPVVFGAVNTVIVPLMFLSRKAAPWAFVITVLTVLVGTAGMAYYSALDTKVQRNVEGIVLNSTFPDIVILFAKLPLGYVMLRITRQGSN